MTTKRVGSYLTGSSVLSLFFQEERKEKNERKGDGVCANENVSR